MKRITIGILAHVDAGKTTTVESMLLNAGTIKKAGRVDHQDAFLDYDAQERARGITIYSKQAYFTWKDTAITILDTPGHIDFSPEMERTLQVLDLAILLINGQDGVQAHTTTIWQCLEHYRVPTLLFVNKMDIAYQSPEELFQSLQEKLPGDLIDYTSSDKEEQISLCDDELLNEYLEKQTLDRQSVKEAFFTRKFFPVLFGSALKNTGITELMQACLDLAPEIEYPQEFGARIFKITGDEQGNKLTHIKLTGGSLKPKTILGDEKVDQIRLYNGTRYTLVQEALPGMVVSLKGLNKTEIGQGLGFEKDSPTPMLNGYLTYRMLFPEGANKKELIEVCKKLNDQDPSLQIETDDTRQTVHLSLMGDIQLEVLQKRIFDMTGVQVSFGMDRVQYMETLAEPVNGYGHFEVLRHYAEVHVKLEPLPRGKGLVIENTAQNEDLAYNWQQTILRHLKERPPRGVLTGSRITDMKITLLTGKSHPKHSQTGDFRQAANRAVRQGLKSAECVLLEPYYRFELEVSSDYLGKALYDMENREAKVEVKEKPDNTLLIRGIGPVRTLMNIQSEIAAYTRGTGKFSCALDGYYPCQDPDQQIEACGYDSEADRYQPTGSLFLMHGSPTDVPYDEVIEHLDISVSGSSSSEARPVAHTVKEEELKRVFQDLGGRNRRTEKKVRKQPKKTDLDTKQINTMVKKKDCLIIDGYNMIFSWQELKSLISPNIESARDRLIDLISNYQGYRQIKVLLVFDGYRIPNNTGSSFRQGDLDIVYTRTGQSADQYIERKVYELKDTYRITVATGDGLIQTSALANGAFRMSGSELERRVLSVNKEAMAYMKNK